MAIEYLGLSQINGPLVVLEGVQGASFEEIVEITVDGNEKEARPYHRALRGQGCYPGV